MKALYLGIALTCAATAASAAQKQLAFWNLTEATITQLRLAKPGTNQWGSNQCDNDKDKTVDPDERLKLTGVAPGHYDVKVADKKGRQCVIRDVELTSDGKYAFSLSEEDMQQKCGK